MRKSKVRGTRNRIQAEPGYYVWRCRFDLNGHARKLIRQAFLDQRNHLRWCRLLDLLQFEAARRLSESRIRIRTLEATGKTVAQKLFVFIRVAGVESVQPGFCLIDCGTVGRLCLRLADESDK